jgi:hypothetical protein
LRNLVCYDPHGAGGTPAQSQVIPATNPGGHGNRPLDHRAEPNLGDYNDPQDYSDLMETGLLPPLDGLPDQATDDVEQPLPPPLDLHDLAPRTAVPTNPRNSTSPDDPPAQADTDHGDILRRLIDVSQPSEQSTFWRRVTV